MARLLAGAVIETWRKDDHEEHRNCRSSRGHGGGWSPRGVRWRYAGTRVPFGRELGSSRGYVVGGAGDQRRAEVTFRS